MRVLLSRFAVVGIVCFAPLASLGADADKIEETVARLTKISYGTSPTFSPDDGKVAFLSNVSGVPQVWIVPVKDGWPAKVTEMDDPVGEVAWSTADDQIAFSMAPGGGMNQQVYLVKPDGSGVRRITRGGKDNNWLGRWSHDGRLLSVASSRRSANSIDAYTYDPARGRWELRAKNPGIGWLTDISRDRKRAVLCRMMSRGDTNLYLIDLATGAETLLTPHDPPGVFENGIFSPDGGTVYFLSDKDRDRVAFAHIRVNDEGEPGVVEVIAERADGDLQEFVISEDGATAALLWNVSGKSELAFVDLGSGDARPGPELPGEIAGGLRFSRDGRLLAMAVSGAALPSDIWLADVTGGELRQLTRSPHPGVDLNVLVRPTLVRFRSHDGVELTGWLYRPTGVKGPGPVVLSFHGGPESQERPCFRADYQALLSAGISVFAPNVRGSAKSLSELRLKVSCPPKLQPWARA